MEILRAMAVFIILAAAIAFIIFKLVQKIVRLIREPRTINTENGGIAVLGKAEKTKDILNSGIKKTFKLITGGIGLCVISFIILVMSSCIGSSKTETPNPINTNETKKEQKQEIKIDGEITANDLIAEYKNNEVKSDKTYKGKTYNVSGEITDIAVVLGSTYIALKENEEYSIYSVQCFFKDKNEIDKIANLNKGDTVKIQGKIEGKSMNVILKDCKIIN